MEKVQNVLSQVVGGTKLPTAKLGKNGPQVTRLGWGAMGLSAFYGAVGTDEERFKVLDKVYAEGGLFWDSADIYGDSEDLLGKWFALNPDKRKDIFLATKFANCKNPDGSRYIDSTPEYCRKACEKSLQRLGLESIDLYYVHRLDCKTPIEKTVEEMKKLKEEGKVKYLGMSECSAESLRRACKVVHIDAVQLEYSPFSLDIEQPETDLLKTARELGVAIVAYSPIGRGMLGGQIRSPKDFDDQDFRKFLPRFSEENFPKNLELADKITEIAKKKGVSASQLTLAWLLAQGEDIFPIPGTTKLQRIEENFESLKIKVSKEEDTEIREACENAVVSGPRYAEAMSQYSFADTPPL